MQDFSFRLVLLQRLDDPAAGTALHGLFEVLDFPVAHGPALMQIHSDATYGRHPLAGLIPENPPRGGGVQLYLLGIDPDAACARAEAAGGTVLETPADKPHGLREATILAPEGQAFSPAVARR